MYQHRNRYRHRYGTKYRVYNESEADSIAGLAIATNCISNFRKKLLH